METDANFLREYIYWIQRAIWEDSNGFTVWSVLINAMGAVHSLYYYYGERYKRLMQDTQAVYYRSDYEGNGKSAIGDDEYFNLLEVALRLYYPICLEE